MGIRKRLGGHLLESRVYLKALGHNRRLRDKTKFYIFGQGRTGSTLLVTLLDSHPEIHCHDELLFDRRTFPMWYIQGKCATVPEPVVGFHVKCYQLMYDQGIPDPRMFVDRLHRKGWRMIFLQREDTFRHAISPLLAARRNLWHASEDRTAKSAGAVRLEPQQVLNCIRKREQYREIESAIIKDYEHLPVSYEKDLNDPEARERISHQLCVYLGVRSEKLASPLKATTSRSLSEAIENYREIAEFLTLNGAGHYLPAE